MANEARNPVIQEAQRKTRIAIIDAQLRAGKLTKTKADQRLKEANER